MQITSKFCLFLSLCFLGACSHTAGNSYKLTNGYRVAVGGVSPKTRIFLIAGSQDSANFSQEILDQKKFWLAQGYSNEEIACYYVPPVKKDGDDENQFKELFTGLTDCYLADPKLLYSHIREVAKANPQSVYVYVTSHGNVPMSENRYDFKDAEIEKKMEKVMALPKWADSYTLEMQGYAVVGKFGIYHNVYKAYLFALENPEAADDYLLTPRGLRNALSALPETTQKYVVLQGCHTGGFILPEKKVSKNDTLAGLKNTKILTASRSDRTSFGCHTAAHMTIFGELYLASLKKHSVGKKISDIDWKRVFDFTQAQIREREMILGVSRESLSRPQFYMN